MPSQLPRYIIRLTAAFLKHQARTWLGEETMDAAGNTLADIGADTFTARVDAWLQEEETRQRLLEVARQADEYFRKHCDDPALVQAFTLDFGTLPSVQGALADLPGALDLDDLVTALENALRRDLGRRLSDEQIRAGARLYAEALQAGVATLKTVAVPVLLQMTRRIRDEQRQSFARMDERLDQILALLKTSTSLSPADLDVLREAVLSGRVQVQGDVSHSVILIGVGNTVHLSPEQVTHIRPYVPLPGDLPPGSYLPFPRNAVFTGRERPLRDLAEALLPDTGDAPAVVVTQAITGMGGVGKTQLAVEFAYRYGYRFKGVHWLDVRDPALLDEQIARSGAAMNVRPWPDELPEQVRRTLDRWRADGPRLLILDNLEDPVAAREVLRRLHHQALRLLITARRRDWPDDLRLRPVPLDEFTPEESRAFLRAFLDKTRAPNADLDALAARLGHLPLALDLAGRYLKRQPFLTVAAYLDRLQDVFAHRSMSGTWRPQLGSATQHDLSLWATFDLSWQQVENEDARRLFLACGFLAANTPIPEAILRGAVADTEALGDAVNDLVGLGLLKEGPAIHPLMAEFAFRLALPEDAPPPDPLVAFLDALADLISATNDEIDRTANYALFSPFLPHVRAAAARAGVAGERHSPFLPIAARLWNSLGYHLHGLADYAGAQAAYERALRIDEAVYGPDHPTVAIRVNNLGSVLRALGDLAGAQAAFERALKIDEAVYGPDHPEVATDVNNLGLVLRALGDLAGARAAFERALQIDETVYGPDHPTVAIRVNNLGSVLWALGDLAGARAAFERALKIDEAVYGPDHPEVATDVNNLGLVLRALGDLAGAKAAFERALGILRAKLPPGHPHIRIVEENLRGMSSSSS